MLDAGKNHDIVSVVKLTLSLKNQIKHRNKRGGGKLIIVVYPEVNKQGTGVEKVRGC